MYMMMVLCLVVTVYLSSNIKEGKVCGCREDDG